MTGSLRRAAKRAAWVVGHYDRALARRTFPGVAVLCYHGVLEPGAAREQVPFHALHVGRDELEAHCALIAHHCHPVSLAAAAAIWAGDAEAPPRPVLVTFDDGYEALLRLALPVLQRHGVPATVFACTGPIATGAAFWFDALARSQGEAAVESAKSLPFADWLALVRSVEAPTAAGDPLAPLSAAELAALARSPLVTVGAHTASHPILARAGADEQRAEIEGSLDAIADWTGRRPTAFAYPNGRPGVDYDARTRAALIEAGVTVAFNTHDGFARRGEPALERSRFMMLHGLGVAELAHRMCHSWR